MCGISFISVGLCSCSQNVPGLWGCNFVGSVIGKYLKLINVKQMLAYMFIGIRLPTKATNIGTPR